MSDMLAVIQPKSDQINYDDFIAGQSKTIVVTGVTIKAGDQPVTFHYQDDVGKPYKPCKSMSRVIVYCWGADAKTYVGKAMTLYGDPNVRFGGADVGGIRISHMSHIDKEKVMALTTTRANRKPFSVKPLIMGEASKSKEDGALPLCTSPTIPLEDWINDIDTAPNPTGLEHKFKAAYKEYIDDAYAIAKLTEAKDKRKSELAAELITVKE